MMDPSTGEAAAQPISPEEERLRGQEHSGEDSLSPEDPCPLTSVRVGGLGGTFLPNHTVTVRGKASVRVSLRLCMGSGRVAVCAGCVGVSVSLPGAECPQPRRAASGGDGGGGWAWSPGSVAALGLRLTLGREWTLWAAASSAGAAAPAASCSSSLAPRAVGALSWSPSARRTCGQWGLGGCGPATRRGSRHSGTVLGGRCCWGTLRTGRPRASDLPGDHTARKQRS